MHSRSHPLLPFLLPPSYYRYFHPYLSVPLIFLLLIDRPPVTSGDLPPFSPLKIHQLPSLFHRRSARWASSPLEIAPRSNSISNTDEDPRPETFRDLQARAETTKPTTKPPPTPKPVTAPPKKSPVPVQCNICDECVDCAVQVEPTGNCTAVTDLKTGRVTLTSESYRMMCCDKTDLYRCEFCSTDFCFDPQTYAPCLNQPTRPTTTTPSTTSTTTESTTTLETTSTTTEVTTTETTSTTTEVTTSPPMTSSTSTSGSVASSGTMPTTPTSTSGSVATPETMPTTEVTIPPPSTLPTEAPSVNKIKGRKVRKFWKNFRTHH